MAIAKMAKLSAIVEESNRNLLMKELQVLQRVEVKPIDPTDLAVELSAENKTSSQFEDQLEDVRAAMRFLDSYLPAASFKEKYLTPLSDMSYAQLENQYQAEEVNQVTAKVWEQKQTLEKIDSELQSLNNEADFLNKWRNLKALPEYNDEAYKYTKLYIGTIPQTSDNEFINAIKNEPKLLVEEIYQNKDEIGLVMAADLDDAYETNQVLAHNRFQALEYKFTDLPANMLQERHARAESLRNKATQTRKEISTMKAEYEELKIAEEMLYAKVEREKAQDLALSTERLFAVEGWVVADEALAIINKIEQTLGSNVYIEVSDVKESEYEEVPVELQNNRFVEPFETVTSMYGLPKYNGFDPSASLTPYYWIFFGMMIADLGYGMLLWAGTFAALKAFNLDAGMRKNVRFFHYLSYSAMLWGLIYGSIFGESLPFRLLSPTEDVIEVLVISVALGLIQILHGLVLNTMINWKNDRLEAVKGGAAWIVMLIGFLVALLGPMLFNIQSLQQVGLWMSAIAALTILGIAIIKSKNKAAGFAAGLYDLYGVSGYLGDIVSYSRLMALGISGGSIALAFNILVAYLPPVARFSIGIVLIIALQLFNFGLSMLSAYVHAARLIFVEFFGKFYEGGGRAFAPLKLLGKHINIK